MAGTSASSFHFSPRPNRAHEIRWRGWGAEAFDEARRADKPLLLGISAVWCHWCHVMDETTYSDPEVIRTINERYVPVRVDNDQRPDVNRRYNMGGWPTTAFLTPDGEIIHGGTYLPPEVMRDYLTQVADVWRDQREDLERRVRDIKAKDGEARRQELGDLSSDIVDSVAALIRGQYDPEYGGFGREPKFPQPKLLRFLLDEHGRHGYPDVATMLHRTLGAMAAGGMYDQVEGGFFRYSTTRQWEIPHYEKMLEDNAELLEVYAIAHREFPSAGYDRVARDVIRWMDATLWIAEAKAFAGSQDADEHYYTLASQDRQSHGAPYVDRTLYTGWNALAASAYLAAHAALGDDSLAGRAHDAMGTLATRMTGPERTLFHFDAGDGPQVSDLLTDFAAFLTATIDAYETGRHPGAYEGAVRIAGAMRERLEDSVEGGFWDAPERQEPGRVTRREKPIEDGAAAADALLRLAALTGDDEWRDSAIRALRGLVGEYRQWGQFAAAYASAVARALAEPLTVTVVGPNGDRVAGALWAAALAKADPAGSRHRLVPGRDDAALERLAYPPDRTAAYVCVGSTCSAPITDPQSLERELAAARRRFARA